MPTIRLNNWWTHVEPQGVVGCSCVLLVFVSGARQLTCLSRKVNMTNTFVRVSRHCQCHRMDGWMVWISDGVNKCLRGPPGWLYKAAMQTTRVRELVLPRADGLSHEYPSVFGRQIEQQFGILYNTSWLPFHLIFLSSQTHNGRRNRG